MALKKPLMAEPDLEAQLPPIPELAPGQLDPPPRDFDNGEACFSEIFEIKSGYVRGYFSS